MMIYGSRFLLMIVSGIIFMVSTSMADAAADLLSNGPIINSTLSEIVLQKGQNFTLSCKGKRPINFTQQEIPEEVFSKFNFTQESVQPTDTEYKYEILLHIAFVDQYAIGYFACSDDTLNASDHLNNLIEEPKNNEHIAYIYIYVNGTDSLFAPMREVLTPRGLSKVVIECRPATPDVEVTLTMASQSNKTPDIIKNSTKIGFLVRNNSRATYQCRGRRRGHRDEWKNNLRLSKVPPQPRISQALKEFLKGESFSLNCTVPYDSTSVVNLEWTYPKNAKNTSIVEDTNRNGNSNHKLIYSHILIKNATEEHAGTYICTASNNVGSKNSKKEKILLPEPKLNLSRHGINPITVNEGEMIKLTCMVEAYPQIKKNQYYYLKDNIPVGTDVTKYTLSQKPGLSDPALTILNLTVTDSANYTLVIFNGYPNYNQSLKFEVLVNAKPIVKFGTSDLTYMENTTASLLCEVMGYPLPDIDWIFSNGNAEQIMKSSSIVKDPTKVYRVESRLNVPVHASGNIACRATNALNSTNVTRKLLVYEIEGGFGIKNRNQTWYAENDDVVLTCLASKYYFDNLTWYNSDDEELFEMVVNKESPFSHVAELKIPQINLTQSGENYTCRGYKTDGFVINEILTLTVEARQQISILEPTRDIEVKLFPFQPYIRSCVVKGVPPPIIDWFKDDDFTKPLISETRNIEIYLNVQNRTKVNSTIHIYNLQKEKIGKYTCKVRNDNEELMKSFTVALLEKEPTTQSYTTYYLVAIAVIIFTLVCLVVYLTCKVKKDKQFRKELNAAGLLYFKKGVTGSLNPELGIDEQAELLPYDDKFEFPTEKLVLGKQLGAGAFGVVYKAEARGIINAEETTPVAVKMVKKTADNMFIKALASELKIMIHMGKHMNIVNLLGACTKNVGKRELVVIVEYCKYGNIHNYMQKHREVFIDQLTDNKEKNLGKVNKGFMTSSGSTGVNSDYFGSNNTQDTDHTFVNTANTNISGRKDTQNQQVEFVKVSEGYVQPEWRSNYESDYSFDGRSPRPLSSRDLLCWAFQIARGMEYLASRKVLHGDLAARNILLADDNVVKICDFGLAKSIYKNDEYRTKENSPLPVKWLAIECMTDRIFSTQSDVWSYGIVLWEMFTLAKTPYPNISPRCLLQWLSEGHRLEKPTYADDRLYDVMLRCWEQKPTLRPSFSQLQELLGTFLEDNVRNHYVDLNSTYMACNVKSEGQEDYLEMVCAPDYKNLVTPSPHHYVNGTSSFFPVTPTQIDEEGYLQMSPKCNQTIFSPRGQGPTFDFDALKFNPRVSEASSGGSELTPMLTLSNLPTRSGSESDHEGNASPYLKMYPRIEEDPDEVFETTQNNAKNMQNTVTNPTYITFNNEPEKNPKDIINNYINVPNGLVN